LYCLGRIAAASSGTVEAPLIGSLMQAIVAAGVEHREHDEFRRSIFFAVKGDVMECACYAGYEGQQDAGRSIFSNSPDDPVGQYMFRLLGEREASLIRDVDAADLTVGFPPRRSYQTIIAVAVMAGESPAGILTLDAPQPDSLGQPDLEIMKTLASLLGVGLALGAHTNMPRLQVPAQSNRELP
jgi:GAF domain-containing protein